MRPEARQQIAAVAVAMWKPFMKATRTNAPRADLVHDKFHVSVDLNEAVDQARRPEPKKLMAAGDETINGSRQLWLYNPMNFSAEQAASFAALRNQGLKVARPSAKDLSGLGAVHQQPSDSRPLLPGQGLRESSHRPLLLRRTCGQGCPRNSCWRFGSSVLRSHP